MPLRALRRVFLYYEIDHLAHAGWRKTSCPCGHCDLLEKITSYSPSMSPRGERHHALAGIATVVNSLGNIVHFCGERHHALAGIATVRVSRGLQVTHHVEKDIMPLRALRLRLPP